MQVTTQTISTEELTSPAIRRQHTTRQTLLRLLRSFAAWWADDSMNARFEQQREHDQQMFHRRGRR